MNKLDNWVDAALLVAVLVMLALVINATLEWFQI